MQNEIEEFRRVCVVLVAGTRVLSPPVLSGAMLSGVAVSSTQGDMSGLPTAVHQMPSVIAKPKLYVPQPNSVATNGPNVSRGKTCPFVVLSLIMFNDMFWLVVMCINQTNY